MRAITKGNEPACLTQHRATPNSNYGDYRGNPALRTALVAEQRGLCCYCMNAIIADGQKMRIEHWQSQSGFPAQQLVYANLLGACKGGEGGSADQYHCDKLKDYRVLKWNPATPAHAIESRIRYQNNGEIRSNDPQFDSELGTVLGLNISILTNRRQGALEAVLKWWQVKKPNKAQVRSQIAKFDNGVGTLEAFSPVAVWFLKRKLAA